MKKEKWPVYAPVLIPTLCRYEHFRRCVESLSRCTGAEYTELYIGLDYPLNHSHEDGYHKICAFIPTIKGFKNVLVYKRETNYGAERNFHDLLERVRVKYDRFILSEDDNEFAPNYLEYMNAGLERYKDDPRVIRICGYLITWDADYYRCMKSYPYNAFPAKDNNSIGVGVWFSKLKPTGLTKIGVLNSTKLTFKTIIKGYCLAILRMIKQLHKPSQLPDVCLRLYCAFNNKYCIFPTISKVRNWGYDGTGLNSDNNPKWITSVELDTSATFEFDEFEIKDYPEVKELVRQMYHTPPGHPFLWILILKKYFFYRITGLRPEDVPGKKKKIKTIMMSIYNHIIK